jgi:hypothetical protein
MTAFGLASGYTYVAEARAPVEQVDEAHGPFGSLELVVLLDPDHR